MRLAAVLFAILASILALLVLLRDLPPPDRLSFAAGPAGGGYWKIAQQYHDLLARDGIDVEVIETAGSLENLGLLAEHKADVGLLQGGIATDDTDIVALGTVFVEPLLIFLRRDRNIGGNPGAWRGLRIARGEIGSGSRAAVDDLIAALSLGPPANRLVDLEGSEVGPALLSGDVDVAVFVAPLAADYLRPLFASPDVTLLNTEFAEAISLRLPYSQVTEVPVGAISLAPILPEEALQLIVLPARLAAIPDLHPAIVDRLVLAGRDIHGGRSLLSKPGQFPTPDGAGMPIDESALKLLLEGQSQFHGWMPYWLAAQIRRVLLVLVPLLFLLIPLIRSLPMAYSWGMQRRVWRYYKQIRDIELELAMSEDLRRLAALDTQLGDIDARLASMKLPPAFRGRAYDARLHVDLVRRHIADRLSEAPKST